MKLTKPRIFVFLGLLYCGAMLAMMSMCGCASSHPTSKEGAVQTPDKTGKTWYTPTKGAK